MQIDTEIREIIKESQETERIIREACKILKCSKENMLSKIEVLFINQKDMMKLKGNLSHANRC